MRAVMDLRDTRQAVTATHSFFDWLRSATVPLERRLDFAPGAALFIMQFRDMNLWADRYAEPRNEFEWVITRGTLEDCTHSQLFLDDWRELGLDERLGWRASDTLWWFFISPEQETMRRAGMRYLSFAVADDGDPFVRFAHSEAGEATGHVFLSNTAAIACELATQTGREYRYFGSYHLERESGHVANTEGVFEEHPLDADCRERALAACSGMFDVFDGIFDAFLTFAKRYVDAGVFPERVAASPSLGGVAPVRIDLTPLYENPASARVAWALDARRARIAAHPFYRWLEETDLDPYERLCRFVPLWIMDILGYRDLAKYALSYPEPHDHAERAINAWATELSGHSALFLSDWDALGLNDRMGFGASDTLQFVFLDPDLDFHRQHLVEFAKLAIKYRHPALRWWMMSALEATGEAFFAHTRPLAEAVERRHGVCLDYFAERHSVDADASRARPERPPAPLPPGQEATAIFLINTVFDAMESQLTRSNAVARSGRFGVVLHGPAVA